MKIIMIWKIILNYFLFVGSTETFSTSSMLGHLKEKIEMGKF
jgi:hypothetical protein